MQTRIEDSKSLLLYAEEVLRTSEFLIREVDLDKQTEWRLDSVALSHKSNGFFHVTGYTDKDGGVEELVLYQPQGAFNGLLLKLHNGVVYVLIQARMEPGNVGIVQYGPTIQSTPGNYLRLHNGRKTPFLNHFFGLEKNSYIVETSTQLDLGKRYYQKTKTLSYVLVDDFVKPANNMVWTSVNALAGVVLKDNFINTDLRSMLGVFDWGQFVRRKDIVNLSLNTSLIWPKSEMNGFLVNLSNLRNWGLTETGYESVDKNKPSITMYETSCIGREVDTWVQPLMTVNGEGVIVLYCKDVGSEMEVLITLSHEFGVTGKAVIMPSLTLYPGESKSNIMLNGDLLKEVRQSEEGGRFYQNINHYQIRKIDKDFDCEPHQIWVNMNQLKAILQTSNQVSIQLRCCASLVLPYLNPDVFD